MPDSIFKVRDSKTGLFSSGGYDLGWSETGKEWDTFNAAMLSLKLYQRGRWDRKNNKVPSTWEIVEYKYTLTPVRSWRGILNKTFDKALNAIPVKK